MATMAAAACDDGNGDGGPDITPLPTLSRTPRAAPTFIPTPILDIVEVTGIVGAIGPEEGTIHITRLSGAPVSRVHVDKGTRMRTASGGPLAFEAIRVSDRIIATGVIMTGTDMLAAREIRIGNALDGSQGG
jgi:hypothetical protein